MKEKILNIWLLIYSILTTFTLILYPMSDPYIFGLTIVFGPLSLLIILANAFLMKKRKNNASNNKLKNISIVIIMLISNTCFGQTNLSFELWSNQFGIAVLEGWVTQNFLALFSTDSISCRASNDAAHGFKSARLRSVEVEFDDTTYIFPGSLSQFYMGAARPKSFRFFYKATGGIKDTFSASLTFHKGAVSSMNTVGSATALLPVTNQWTPVEVDVNWTSTEAYDTAIFGFTSPASLNAELYVDNVDLSAYGAGLISGEKMDLPFFAQHRLVLSPALRNEVKTVSIYNSSGQLLSDSKNTEVDVTTLSPGIYVLTLLSNNRDVLYSGMFLKQ